jgi:hypothetical protein
MMAVIAFFMAYKKGTADEPTLFSVLWHMDPNTGFCHILNIKSKNRNGISKLSPRKMFSSLHFTYFF